MAAFLKPVMKLHYAAGRLTFAQPVSIDGVSPDQYFISGVTAKAGVLYVLEINANRIYRLSGQSYTKQLSAETGNRPYAAELSPDRILWTCPPRRDCAIERCWLSCSVAGYGAPK
jgi:hypothetical protein